MVILRETLKKHKNVLKAIRKTVGIVGNNMVFNPNEIVVSTTLLSYKITDVLGDDLQNTVVRFSEIYDNGLKFLIDAGVDIDIFKKDDNTISLCDSNTFDIDTWSLDWEELSNDKELSHIEINKKDFVNCLKLGKKIIKDNKDDVELRYIFFTNYNDELILHVENPSCFTYYKLRNTVNELKGFAIDEDVFDVIIQVLKLDKDKYVSLDIYEEAVVINDMLWVRKVDKMGFDVDYMLKMEEKLSSSIVIDKNHIKQYLDAVKIVGKADEAIGFVIKDNIMAIKTLEGAPVDLSFTVPCKSSVPYRFILPSTRAIYIAQFLNKKEDFKIKVNKEEKTSPVCFCQNGAHILTSQVLIEVWEEE